MSFLHDLSYKCHYQLHRLITALNVIVHAPHN